MRAVVQRVLRASVSVGEELVGRIDQGLCVLVGVGRADRVADAERLAEKVLGLRIFADEQDRMNRSVLDIGGGLLAISQFTLLGDVRRGKRPSFTDAMDPEPALALFQAFCTACEARGKRPETGRFGADMRVEVLGHGPVTILIDTARAF